MFLLPGNIIPEGTLAGVYVQIPGSSDFRLLGFIGNNKQSAIFKVSGDDAASAEQASAHGPIPANGVVEDEMSDIGGTPSTAEVTVGIAVEPSTTIMTQLDNLKNSESTALVSRDQQPSLTTPSTKILAQRIIKNAFNFLASFAGTTGVGGQEVVPLKSFQDWWSKFERRIENDPGFLERETGD